VRWSQQGYERTEEVTWAKVGRLSGAPYVPTELVVGAGEMSLVRAGVWGA